MRYIEGMAGRKRYDLYLTNELSDFVDKVLDRDKISASRFLSCLLIEHYGLPLEWAGRRKAISKSEVSQKAWDAQCRDRWLEDNLEKANAPEAKLRESALLEKNNRWKVARKAMAGRPIAEIEAELDRIAAEVDKEFGIRHLRFDPKAGRVVDDL